MTEPSATTSKERLWIALSDLFLDTEVRWSLPYVARVAVEEGFSWNQVCHILDAEVTPVLGPNLSDVAGEWAGFPEDWLLAQLRQSSGVENGKRLLSEKLYDGLEALCLYLSRFPPFELRVEESRLSALIKLCFEVRWTRLGSFWSWTRRLACWPLEVVDQSFQVGIRPFIFRQLGRSQDPTPVQLMENWGRFRSFLVWLEAQSEMDRSGLLDCCEELTYAFTVPNLASTPRGALMLKYVAESDLTNDRVEELLGEPLGKLYGGTEDALRAWRALAR